MQTSQNEEKIRALETHIGINKEDYFYEAPTIDSWGAFTSGDKEYRVLTDAEADLAAREYILDSLWAFNTSFLVGFMADEIREIRDRETLEKSLAKMQEYMCEDANPIIYALVKDKIEKLIQEAISSDGRGHFLAGYDCEEYEENNYYIYRTN